MKAQPPAAPPAPPRRTAGTPFAELLHRHAGAAAPLPRRVLVSAPLTERLRTARDGMHREAGRLQEVRAEGEAVRGARATVRAAAQHEQGLAAGDTLLAERVLQRLALPEREAPPAVGGGDGGARPGLTLTAAREPAPSSGPARAQAVRAIVERVEVFLRGTRPALALTLAQGPFASVAVERTGPGEVALRLAGRGGPPPTEALAALREGLAARGLRVRSLRVAAPGQGVALADPAADGPGA